MGKKYNTYIGSKGEVEKFLSCYIHFDFSVDFMPGDGFLLLDYENSRVAPVEKCFEIILEKGVLEQSDMLEISI